MKRDFVKSNFRASERHPAFMAQQLKNENETPSSTMTDGAGRSETDRTVRKPAKTVDYRPYSAVVEAVSQESENNKIC